MKKENGITMVSLVVYVLAMLVVLGILSAVRISFYTNIENSEGNIEEIVEFNKFNTYFLEEIKRYNNEVESLSANYILFSSGNSFSIANNSIYYNNIKICENVKEMLISLEQDANGKNNIINVFLDMGNFSKSIKYKVENIY